MVYFQGRIFFPFLNYLFQHIIMLFFQKLCLVIAVFTHYLWLSVFFWMLAQGIFLYMKLRLAVRSDANIVWFCLIGWGE